MSTDRRRLIGSAAAGGAAAAVGWLLRRWQTRWGATADEVRRRLPGDDIVARPQYAATNAVTVGAEPAAVWPWLVQMGCGRGGWYSFDRLDNGGVPSVREIVPDLQDLQVGEVLPTDRDGTGFVAEAIDPPRSLVLVIRSPDGVTSSVLHLEPTSGNRTRLVCRLRLRAPWTPAGTAYRALMEVGHAIMTRKMLLGIKHRAEDQAAGRAPATP